MVITEGPINESKAYELPNESKLTDGVMTGLVGGNKMSDYSGNWQYSGF